MAPMNEPKPPLKPSGDKTSPTRGGPDPAKAAREARLGEALRANLRRRKGPPAPEPHAPDPKKSR
jgi:hypothetical protein